MKRISFTWVLLVLAGLVGLEGRSQGFFPPVRGTGVIVKGDPDPVKPPVAATPEPATIVSGLIGLAALGGYRLRKQKAVVA
jgi:hypothetical protein